MKLYVVVVTEKLDGRVDQPCINMTDSREAGSLALCDTVILSVPSLCEAKASRNRELNPRLWPTLSLSLSLSPLSPPDALPFARRSSTIASSAQHPLRQVAVHVGPPSSCNDGGLAAASQRARPRSLRSLRFHCFYCFYCFYFPLSPQALPIATLIFPRHGWLRLGSE